jgi:FkbM family methyltransferase
MLVRYNYDSIKYQDLTIYYNNEESARQTIAEIFGNRHYQFKADKENPFIIDAGSNIGIATLFLKKIYPAAKIICFEPDPNAFDVLQLNIQANHLQDVTLINAALSSHDGLVDFYGQIHVDHPDARGNSIIDVWGGQRATVNRIQVQSVRLSSFLDDHIDFLKLDIEGAEEEVLTELGVKLKFIKQMCLEFHDAKIMQETNNLDRVKALLEYHGFNYEIIANDISILPGAVKDWANKINPHLYTIKANQNL